MKKARLTRETNLLASKQRSNYSTYVLAVPVVCCYVCAGIRDWTARFMCWQAVTMDLVCRCVCGEVNCFALCRWHRPTNYAVTLDRPSSY